MARPRLPIGQHGKISLTRAKHGWLAVTYMRKDDGQIHKVTATRTSKEGARIALEETCARNAHEAEGAITATTTIRRLGEQWLESKRPEIRPQTLKGYSEAVRKHITPRLGGYQIAEITPMILRNTLLKINHEHGYGAAMHARQALNGMLGLAVRENAVSRNAASQIGRLPTTDKPKGGKAVHPSQIPVLARNIRNSTLSIVNKNVALLMLYTGMRAGEVLALQWDDIDLEHGILHVRATVIKDHGKVKRQEATKTATSRRDITLSRHALEVLKDEQRLFGTLPLVFPSADGWLEGTDSFDASFKRARKSLGFPGIRLVPHSLRKTFATAAHTQGMDDKDISDYLGHAHSQITEEVYMRRNVNSRSVAQALDRVIDGGSGGEEAE